MRLTGNMGYIKFARKPRDNEFGKFSALAGGRVAVGAC